MYFRRITALTVIMKQVCHPVWQYDRWHTSGQWFPTCGSDYHITWLWPHHLNDRVFIKLGSSLGGYYDELKSWNSLAPPSILSLFFLNQNPVNSLIVVVRNRKYYKNLKRVKRDYPKKKEQIISKGKKIWNFILDSKIRMQNFFTRELFFKIAVFWKTSSLKYRFC